MIDLDVIIADIPEFKKRSQDGDSFISLLRDAKTPSEKREILQEVRKIVQKNGEMGRISRLWNRAVGREDPKRETDRKISDLNSVIDATYWEEGGLAVDRIRDNSSTFRAMTNDVEVVIGKELFTEALADLSFLEPTLSLLEMEKSRYEEVYELVKENPIEFVKIADYWGLNNTLYAIVLQIALEESTEEGVLELAPYLTDFVRDQKGDARVLFAPGIFEKVQSASTKFEDPFIEKYFELSKRAKKEGIEYLGVSLRDLENNLNAYYEREFKKRFKKLGPITWGIGLDLDWGMNLQNAKLSIVVPSKIFEKTPSMVVLSCYLTTIEWSENPGVCPHLAHIFFPNVHLDSIPFDWLEDTSKTPKLRSLEVSEEVDLSDSRLQKIIKNRGIKIQIRPITERNYTHEVLTFAANWLQRIFGS